MLKLDDKKYEISKKEINLYNTKGYLVLPILSSEEIERILDLHVKYADENFSALMHIERKEEELYNFIKLPRIVSVIETILKGESIALMSQMLFKKPGTVYAHQAWTVHQDNSYHQSPNSLSITVNVACEDMNKENGTMYLYPGSHKEGLMEFQPRISFREDPTSQPGNTIALPEKYIDKKTDLIMKKGDVLFMHGNCAHGSYPNFSKILWRPVYAITYIKKGESFAIGKNADRKEISLH